MKKKKEGKQPIKRALLALVVVFGIILIFAFIDFFIHSLSKEYSVPSYYFRNKIIFGTIIGFFSYMGVRNKKVWIKALAFSLTISVLLQIRYFLEGYPKDFVFLFLGIHFVILLLVSWLIFRLANNKI